MPRQHQPALIGRAGIPAGRNLQSRVAPVGDNREGQVQRRDLQHPDVAVTVDVDHRHLPFGDRVFAVRVDRVEGHAARLRRGFRRFGGSPPGGVPGVPLGEEELLEGVARGLPRRPVFGHVKPGEGDGRQHQQ